MELSKKKETELYGVVHKEIMQARLKIWKMRFEQKPSISEIDNILSDLCIKTPQKAIECFGAAAKQTGT
jgi:hypothetical protein